MCHARCGGPRTLSRTTDANLDCAFVEKTLVFVVPNIEGPGPLGPPLNDPLPEMHTTIHMRVDI